MVTVEHAPGLYSLETIFAASVTGAMVRSSIVAVVLALLLGIFFSGYLTKPLEILTGGVKKISSGNLQHRITITTADEMGALALAFNDMADSLAENEQLRKSLVADVAHELRTPLAVLRGNFESMQAGIKEPTEENLALLHDEVLRMTYLVKDLQELSLAEAGQLSLDLCAVNIEKLVSGVVEKLSYEAEGKKVTLTTDFQVSGLQVDLDVRRLSQVLYNIIGNSLRYTPAGGTVTVSVDADSAGLLIEVADTGPGIPEADLPYIFERFYRSDKARTRSSGGVGLGLAIAKGFVEAHGGTVTAANRPSGGSMFTIKLPA